MSRGHVNSSFVGRFAALLVVLGSIGLWMLWIPFQIEAVLPLGIRQWLERGDTPALLVLFILLPVGLAVLACLAALFAGILLRPFVSRSQVERTILAAPFGGHIGRLEKAFLGMFKER